MKLNKYISLLALPLAFVACQNDGVVVEQPEQPVESQGLYKLYGAVQTDADSRAQIVLNNEEVGKEKFIWNAGDSFSVYRQQDGGPRTPNVFTIDSKYSDDASSSSAYFTSETALEAGEFYAAIYPNRHTTNQHGIYTTLELTTSVPNGSAEGWKQYFSENMFMKAYFVASEDSSIINFQQLSTLARITYTNATGVTQMVNQVEFFGPAVAYEKGVYPFSDSVDFGSISLGNSDGHMPSVQIQFEEPVEIADGDSYNFYVIFFSGSRVDNYEDEYQSIKIRLSTSSPSYDSGLFLETPEIPASLVLGTDNDYSWVVGGRYWFKITQTEDELTWTNNLESSRYVKNLEFLEAIEAGNPGITFTRNDFGFVDVKENKHLFESVVSLNFPISEGKDTLQLDHTEGLEHFTNLTSLNLNYVKIDDVDLSHNKNLESFSCVGTQIRYLDFGHNLKLKTVDCHDSEACNLTFSTNNQLTSLDCTNCALKNSWDIQDISKCTSLQTLKISGNKLSSLNITKLTQLETLECGNQKEDITLELLLTEAQKAKWNSTWAATNTNVTCTVAE